MGSSPNIVSDRYDKTKDGLTEPGIVSMNILQGRFFTTAFRVVDDDGFATDPAVDQMRQNIEFFSGEREGERLYCLVHKGGLPETTLRVARSAVMGLLADAKASSVPIQDGLGWIATLQRHLNPEDGIVILHRNTDGSEYQAYIAPDCAGWTRES